jgi:hypothetical protein
LYVKRVTKAQIRKITNKKDMVVVTHNLRWKWGGLLASRGPVRMGTGYIYCIWCVGISKENWATAGLMGRNVREGSRKTFVMSSHKLERKEQIRHL